MADKQQQDLNPADLPEETFKKKEVYQHPQPADTGKPTNPKSESDHHKTAPQKEEQKTSKEAGLNEERSAGDAGAFEGFENHG